MQRRELLTWLLTGAAGVGLTRRSIAVTPDEINRQMSERREKALAQFPLKLIETTGEQVLAKWEELKSAGQGVPIVLGDTSRSFNNLLEPFDPGHGGSQRSVAEIIGAASSINFPEDLANHKKASAAKMLEQLKATLAAKPNAAVSQDLLSAMGSDPPEPDLGEWPDVPSESSGLSVAFQLGGGQPAAKVYIGLAATDDWTTLPAHLRWGGWNDCPAAEYHVAAMRRWRDRYGVELIGMNSDTMNLRVASKPKTREEALALAREQYIYCNDIIDQGVGTYNALAAYLMTSDWWFFWWD